jgi:DSF synthase
MDNKFPKYKSFVIEYDEARSICWLYLDAAPRPCFSLLHLDELFDFKQFIITQTNVRFIVFASRVPNVFSLGGDLNYFAQMLEQKNRKALLDYSILSAKLVYSNYMSSVSGIIPIALVQGQAMGGGFELALSCKYCIAEQNATVGLPEILFNTFPASGAFQFLAQRLSIVKAQDLITNGRTYTAVEAQQLGLIDENVPSGEGYNAVIRKIEYISRSFSAHIAVYQLRNMMFPLSENQFVEVAHLWVDKVMSMEEHNIELIRKLVIKQNKLYNKIN